LPATGTVYLESCGAISIGKNVTFTGVTGASDSFRFNVYANGNITLGQSSVIYAIVQAPTKDVTLAAGLSAGSKTTLFGLVHSTTTTLNKYSQINATGLTGQACVDAAINVVPGTCPVTIGAVAPPPGTGTCSTNASGYKDPSAAGTDLAIEYTCGSPLRVCNHGNADAPSGTAISFYPRTSNQFAVETPDANFLEGTCTVTSPIPAGTCVDQTCDASLFSSDAFIVINGKGTTGAIAEYSYLDNWSLYQKSATCGGPPTGSYTYEATCSSGTSPRWGLLTYSTATPGLSTVQFEARTATTSAALTSSTFILVSEASTALGTSVCPKTSAIPGCPVDLTNKLSLGSSQPSFLELKYTGLDDGTNVPSVAKWEVTYSCVDDQ
jgi:hypothetical protein